MFLALAARRVGPGPSRAPPPRPLSTSSSATSATPHAVLPLAKPHGRSLCAEARVVRAPPGLWVARREHGGHSHGPPDPTLYSWRNLVDYQRWTPGVRITWLGVASNVGLAVLKLFVGLAASSAALVADAAHSLSDLVSDFVALATLHFMAAPLNSRLDYPWGRGKIENLGTLAVSALLLATGVATGHHSVMSLLSATSADASLEVLPQTISLIVAGLSVAIKEIMYWATITIARREHSSILEANAWHHRNDALTSLVALVGIFASLNGYPACDGLAGLLVSGIIIKMGYTMSAEAAIKLLDRGIEREMYDRMADVISTVPDVVGFHALRARRSGSYVTADVHIEVDGSSSVSAAHNTAEIVRRALMLANKELREVLVHVDPIDSHKRTPPPMAPSSEVDSRVRKALRPFVDLQVVGIERISVHYHANETVSVDLLLNVAADTRLADTDALVRDMQSSVSAAVPQLKNSDDVNIFFAAAKSNQVPDSGEK